MPLQMMRIADDIERYLKTNASKGLLRFLTCGGADDGKSTLIGRLLHDALTVQEDQLAALVRESGAPGSRIGQVDLALLVDGLQSEREQGMTIDVAYRFFCTDKRKFIIADAPGHEQYTRNMATGASTADLAIILIDARYGVQLQTRRHSFICDLLGIRHFVIAINKMDLVGYSEARFQEIVADYRDFADKLNVNDVRFLPISALTGANVVNPGSEMRWYEGAPLLAQLEQIEILSAPSLHELRFPVQYVNRPNLNFRGYSGTLAAGAVEVGTEIRVEPSGKRSTIERIVTNDGDLSVAYPGQSVTLTLRDPLDISRGDMLVAANSDIEPSSVFTADVVWMHETPLAPGQEYEFKAGTRIVSGRVTRIVYQIDVNTLARSATDALPLNGIARCQIEVTQPLVLDSYQRSPETGNFIFIDKLSNLTVGAGMVVDALNIGHVVWHDMAVDKRRRAERNRQKPSVIWFTGLSGAGKSTVADALERQLFGMGYNTYVLDGDNVRHGLCRDLGFSDRDRQENIRRVGEVAKLMVDVGVITLVSFISPFREDRRIVRDMVEADEFIEVFVNTPLSVCERRDPKGLYRKARTGEIDQFTGITSPYEAPESPEIEIDTSIHDLEETVGQLIAALRRHRII
ncbi:sulfate adenylyltransferase subunit CysN [Salinicola acroporae]|uniref:Multifunctional fusion protein n=1 Tax=Salinicola acroporae TaxID=1541440 RepID=A0ABT6I5U7_9GAMM|nr:sulfate adenylyltransferase subunit CysN [Salinicola acroporae]MDH4572931.1 bifunctional sulfate adenylyltransferase subunit 1/adenylylsulfate kinase [Salinicola acroporae]